MDARRVALGLADRAVVAVVSAAIAAVGVTAVLGHRIEVLESKAAKPVVLTESTVVRHTWRTPDGVPVINSPSGTYEQPLWQYHDYSGDIAQLKIAVNDYRTLLTAVVSDPEKRAILLRHDFTDAQLDTLARHFSASR